MSNIMFSVYVKERLLLILLLCLYMFYLGWTASKVYRRCSMACRAMHALSTIICAFGVVYAGATL